MDKKKTVILFTHKYSYCELVAIYQNPIKYIGYQACFLNWFSQCYKVKSKYMFKYFNVIFLFTFAI